MLTFLNSAGLSVKVSQKASCLENIDLIDWFDADAEASLLFLLNFNHVVLKEHCYFERLL